MTLKLFVEGPIHDLGRAMLEALSVGTPVVAWNTGGSAEAVDHGVNGWLVDDDDDLRLALAQLRSRDAREAAGRAAVAAKPARTVERNSCPTMRLVFIL